MKPHVLLLWQSLGGSVTQAWQRWGCLVKVGTGVLCCVTQLIGLNAVKLVFGVLFAYSFLFFLSSSLSNHRSYLLTAVCLGSSEPWRTCLTKLKS